MENTHWLDLFGGVLRSEGCLYRLLLHPGDLLVGQADGVDHVVEWNLPSQVQQSDVTVQVFLPVVLWVDDYLVDHHDLLDAMFKPGHMRKDPIEHGW